MRKNILFFYTISDQVSNLYLFTEIQTTDSEMRVQPCGWALSRNTEGPRFHGAGEVCWEALQQVWRRNTPIEKRDNSFFFAGDFEQVKQADKHIHIHIFKALYSETKSEFSQKELWLELPSPQGLDLTEFKSIHITLWVMMYFPVCNTFPTDETLLASLCSVPVFSLQMFR